MPTWNRPGEAGYYPLELGLVVRELYTIVGDAENGYRLHQASYLEHSEEKCRVLEQSIRDFYSRLLHPDTDAGANIGSRVFLQEAFKNLDYARYSLEKVVRSIRSKIMDGVLFTDRAADELDILFDGFKSCLKNLYDLLVTGNMVLKKHVEEQVDYYRGLCRNYASEHEDRLIQGVCLPRSSSMYMIILDSMSDVFWHMGNVIRPIPNKKAN